ncbi:RimK family alpha-L-glutamate ligase [Novosphingobium aerophilum]|uniref:ATP-grasp domain-containing protein n=1 Tax=Novosphingobium TaxID=165696 RepID=UPI0012C77619|nr:MULTISPECIES: RimK family alpha-L-glutamate ligase [unclassified Novosphingobium]MPS70221.1 RimK family alpha-L-glutamate ligase [Novosphingobium sp.]WRT94808.1 RimK family alpha-L-glutamate ligase [Novosphingobium sp. RL4]
MRGWVLFHRELDPAIPEVPEILRFQEAASAMGIELHILNPHRFDLIVGAGDDWGTKYQGHPMERPDFILCRTGAETDYFTLALLRHFERRGVRLVNGPATIERVADKLHTLQSLSRAGLPIPRTILGTFPIDVGLVERELGFPLIVKTLKGTRGAGVLKCEDREQFEDLAGLLESAEAKADFILQHYVRASHGRDVRVLVVGGRVVAAMERRSMTGGFKSNVSLGGVGVAYNPPPEMAELAVQAADVLGLDVTGIDILFDEDGYRICEANSAPGFQGLERASGMDVPSAILEWIRSTQDAPAETPVPAESNALAELMFGGRTGLRSISDRNADPRRFARAIGLRMIAAGVNCLAHAAIPAPLVDRKSRTSLGLRTLFEGRVRTDLSALDDLEQERTLLVVLGVAIWAAVLPWLAGAEAALSGLLSVIALSFPMLFLFTAPAGRFGKPASQLRRKMRR